MGRRALVVALCAGAGIMFGNLIVEPLRPALTDFITQVRGCGFVCENPCHGDWTSG
jgi:hypothetical protein